MRRCLSTTSDATGRAAYAPGKKPIMLLNDSIIDRRCLPLVRRRPGRRHAHPACPFGRGPGRPSPSQGCPAECADLVAVVSTPPASRSRPLARQRAGPAPDRAAERPDRCQSHPPMRPLREAASGRATSACSAAAPTLRVAGYAIYGSPSWPQYRQGPQGRCGPREQPRIRGDRPRTWPPPTSWPRAGWVCDSICLSPSAPQDPHRRADRGGRVQDRDTGWSARPGRGRAPRPRRHNMLGIPASASTATTVRARPAQG